MKRTFYEMIGVQHDADQATIDVAYTQVMERLNEGIKRGASDATMEAQLVRDGYQILSDPAKRVRYDAKLSAAESGVQLMFFPEDGAARRKLGVETIIFAFLATVLGGIVYYQLTSKMNEVRVEHAQAVTRQKGEQEKVKTIDATKPQTSVASAASNDQKR